MDDKDKNKWKVRMAVLAIFLLGFAAGLLALNVYNKWSANQMQQADGRAERIEQIFERLQLNDAQQSEVRDVFSDARNHMQEMRKADAARRKDVRSQTDVRLQKILTPAQWQQFQAIRSESGDPQRGRRTQNRE